MKKKKDNSSLITGLIVGGAVVSVTAMLVAKNRRQGLPEHVKQSAKPLSFWGKLCKSCWSLVKKFF